MRRAVLWPVVAGVLAVVVLVTWRNFFWQHALIVGIGIAALVYTAIRTVDQLKNIHKH